MVSALQHVAELPDDVYVEVDEASAAVAAAEIVASARDGDVTCLSGRAREIFPKYQQNLTGSHLLDLGRRACRCATRRRARSRRRGPGFDG